MLYLLLTLLLVLWLASLLTRTQKTRITDCPSCIVVQPTETLQATSVNATKRALLLGLNYEGTSSELFGCIQDVANIRAMLIATLGFQAANITTLTDDTLVRPTHDVILEYLQTLISATAAGDVAFVWFSGHGLLIPNGASPSGQSNAWYPLDGRSAGLIVETELQAIVSQAPARAKVFVGSDCCHSGTLLDLKYMVGAVSMVRVTKDAKARDARAQDAQPKGSRSALMLEGGVSALLPHSMPRPDYTSMHFPSHTKSPSQAYVLVSDANHDVTDADVVCLSGCRDDQVSQDFYRNNQPQGAMTWAFLTTLNTFGKTLALSNLLSGMRLLLTSNFLAQIPQLTLGRAGDPSKITVEQLL